MIITKETDYALRILRSLRDGELHTVGQIAGEEFIPQAFAYKITKKLDSTGLIEVLRGSSGGCRLTADLSRLSLYDLMAAIGDRGGLSSCMDPQFQCSWRSRQGRCSVHCKLMEIQDKLDRELRTYSLESLLAEW